MKREFPKPRESRTHVLKCWMPHFEAVRAGRKTFEYRLNDRDFQLGDCLVLREYNPETGSVTDETLSVRVVYLLGGGKFGVPEQYCVLGIEPWARTPIPLTFSKIHEHYYVGPDPDECTTTGYSVVVRGPKRVTKAEAERDAVLLTANTPEKGGA